MGRFADMMARIDPDQFEMWTRLRKKRRAPLRLAGASPGLGWRPENAGLPRPVPRAPPPLPSALVALIEVLTELVAARMKAASNGRVHTGGMGTGLPVGRRPGA